jgi:hypothetical protein
MALAAMPGTSLMSKIAFKKHEEALQALGLVDDKNNPTWFTEGKPDLIKMLSIAGGHAADIPLTKRAGYEKQLFGAQGFGGFALLADPAVKARIAALGAEMNSPEFKSRYGSFMQDYAGASPLQMGRTTWADLQNALMDLGKTVMPAVTHTLKDFDQGIKDSEAQVRGFGGAISSAIAAARNWFSGPPTLGTPGAQPDPGAAARQELNRKLNPTGDKHSELSAPMHIKTAVYLDGRVIGETMSSEMARLSMFPRQASYSDPYAMWMPGDWQATT